MKKLKALVAVFAMMVFGAFVFVPAGPASALDPSNPLEEVCSADGSSDVCKSQGDDANDLIKTLVNVLLFIVGALSTIMIIVGGIFYAISNGDAGKVAKAKNTILYSVVGLVVALLAYAIVNWVLVVL